MYSSNVNFLKRSTKVIGSTLLLLGSVILQPAVSQGSASVWSAVASSAAVTSNAFDVAMAASGTTLVVSSLTNGNSSTTASAVARVDVFEFDAASSSWTTLASKAVSSSRFGEAVAVSSDGSRIVVGNPKGSGTGGQVSVWDVVGGNLVAVGTSIEPGVNYEYFGYDVAISTDGSRIAAISLNDPGPSCCVKNRTRAVRVYDYDGSNWVQAGSTITLSIDDSSHSTSAETREASVALSGDGSTLVIGDTRSPHSGSGGSEGGSVSVYNWNSSGSGWDLAKSYQSSSTTETLGASVSANNDGTVVVAGAPDQLNNGTGYAYVYTQSEASWSDTGVQLVASGGYSTSSSLFGMDVAINSDGSRVVIGSPGLEVRTTSTQYNVGRAYVFDFTSTWTLSAYVDGSTANRRIGARVAIADTNDAVAVAFGNGTSANVYGTIDTTAPTVSVTVDQATNPGSVSVTSSEVGTVYAVLDSITVSSASDLSGAADASMNSASVTTANTAVTISTTGLSDGNYDVYAVDAAGNVSTAATTGFTIDTPAATTTTTAPTTTTTIAPERDSEGGLLELEPGEVGSIVDGRVEVVDVRTVDTVVELFSDEFSLNVGAKTSNAEAVTPTADGRLVVNEDASVEVSGEGFEPGGQVEVWLFSEPQLLGVAEVASDGTFSGSFSLPSGVEVGTHTLQADGKTADGSTRTLNLGIEVVPDDPSEADGVSLKGPDGTFYELEPATAAILVDDNDDGVATASEADYSETNGQISVTTDSELSLLIAPSAASEQITTTTQSTASIIFEQGSEFIARGTGYEPGAKVEVWVASTPRLLGIAEVGEDGNYELRIPVPTDLPVGGHTIQSEGLASDGLSKAVSVGITVQSQPTAGELPATGQNSSLPLALSLLIVGLVIVMTRRRHDQELTNC